jgi:hypothetical protein
MLAGSPVGASQGASSSYRGRELREAMRAGTKVEHE